MMHILILEDRGDSVKYLIEYLRKNGHEVSDAVTINQAKHYWSKRKEKPIDCIILDLNMSSSSLSDKLKKDTVGGLLSGWVWVKDSVLSEEPFFRNRIIIYSDYVEDFESHVPANERKGIEILQKSKSPSLPTLLNRFLQKIESKKR
jgi:hypothetical protein